MNIRKVLCLAVVCLPLVSSKVSLSSVFAAETICRDGPAVIGNQWYHWYDNVTGIVWNNQGFVACSAERYCTKWAKKTCDGMKNEDRFPNYVARCKDVAYNAICGGLGSDHSSVKFCICAMRRDAGSLNCQDINEVASNAFARVRGDVPKPNPYDVDCDL